MMQQLIQWQFILISASKTKLVKQREGEMLSAIGTLGRLDYELKIKLLVHRTDLQPSDIVEARKTDSDADKLMMIFKYGLPMQFKMGDHFRHWAVLEHMLHARDASMGTRMTQFKAKHIKPDGTICWKGVCYTLKYDGDNKLVPVQHWNGDLVNTPPWASHLNRQYDLVANWDDHGAYLERKPIPPIPVWKLFLPDDKNDKQTFGALPYSSAERPAAQGILPVGRGAVHQPPVRCGGCQEEGDSQLTCWQDT